MIELIPGSEGLLRARNPIRVAGYFRISNSFSKSDALAILRRMLRNRIGRDESWVYTGSYYDRDISGMENDPRMAFDRMMEEARAGKFDLLLTESIEHFTPTADETIQCVEELRSLLSPVRIIFLKDGVDSETVHAVVPIVRGWRP